MRTQFLATATAGAAVAFTAGVMWTAPLATAGSDFCNSLGNPAQIRDCNCGADNHPGTPEYQECLHGNAASPEPGKPVTP